MFDQFDIGVLNYMKIILTDPELDGNILID
jgi:hypothetical protein